jgi:hypothetical protein
MLDGLCKGGLFDFPFNFGHFESLSSPHFCRYLIYQASNHRPNKDSPDGEMPDSFYYLGW